MKRKQLGIQNLGMIFILIGMDLMMGVLFSPIVQDRNFQSMMSSNQINQHNGIHLSEAINLAFTSPYLLCTLFGLGLSILFIVLGIQWFSITIGGSQIWKNWDTEDSSLTRKLNKTE